MIEHKSFSLSNHNSSISRAFVSKTRKSFVVYEHAYTIMSSLHTFPLDNLADHLIVDIFGYFYPIDICKQFSSISRKFYRLTNSKRLWHSVGFFVDETAVDRNRCFGRRLAKVCIIYQTYIRETLFIFIWWQMASAIAHVNIRCRNRACISLNTFKLIFMCKLPTVTHFVYHCNYRTIGIVESVQIYELFIDRMPNVCSLNMGSYNYNDDKVCHVVIFVANIVVYFAYCTFSISSIFSTRLLVRWFGQIWSNFFWINAQSTRLIPVTVSTFYSLVAESSSRVSK